MRRSVFAFIAAIALFSGSAVIAGDFTDNGDGTVTDGNTGLMWQQGEAGYMNWEDAIICCEDLTLAGYDGWRLPNIKELESLTDASLYNPAIDTDYFPDAHAWSYWTSTGGQTTGAYYKWCVNFESGQTQTDARTDQEYVRCVRSGQ
jgi:hypothetical protein